jgi:hypothetical protein
MSRLFSIFLERVFPHIFYEFTVILSALDFTLSSLYNDNRDILVSGLR